MKTQEQSQQEQEIERLLVKLRKQTGNESMARVYFRLIVGGLATIVSIEALIKGTASALNILVILGFPWLALTWLFRSTDNSTDNSEKETMQMSAGELALKFEEMKKHCGQLIAIVSIAMLCWGISILIGVFELSEFFITLCAIGCVVIVSGAYDYWENQKNERIARRLEGQSDD